MNYVILPERAIIFLNRDFNDLENMARHIHYLDLYNTHDLVLSHVGGSQNVTLLAASYRLNPSPDSAAMPHYNVRIIVNRLGIALDGYHPDIRLLPDAPTTCGHIQITLPVPSILMLKLRSEEL